MCNVYVSFPTLDFFFTTHSFTRTPNVYTTHTQHATNNDDDDTENGPRRIKMNVVVHTPHQLRSLKNTLLLL